MKLALVLVLVGGLTSASSALAVAARRQCAGSFAAHFIAGLFGGT
jgi:hypothetical protein